MSRVRHHGLAERPYLGRWLHLASVATATIAATNCFYLNFLAVAVTRRLATGVAVFVTLAFVPEAPDGGCVDDDGSRQQLRRGPERAVVLAVLVDRVDGEADGSDEDDEDAEGEEAEQLQLSLPRDGKSEDEGYREEEKHEVGDDVEDAEDEKLHLGLGALARIWKNLPIQVHGITFADVEHLNGNVCSKENQEVAADEKCGIRHVADQFRVEVEQDELL